MFFFFFLSAPNFVIDIHVLSSGRTVIMSAKKKTPALANFNPKLVHICFSTGLKILKQNFWEAVFFPLLTYNLICHPKISGKLQANK